VEHAGIERKMLLERGRNIERSKSGAARSSAASAAVQTKAAKRIPIERSRKMLSRSERVIGHVVDNERSMVVWIEF